MMRLCTVLVRYGISVPYHYHVHTTVPVVRSMAEHQTVPRTWYMLLYGSTVVVYSPHSSGSGGTVLYW